MGVRRVVFRNVVALIAAAGVLTACSDDSHVFAPPSLPVPPPAVSAVDRTVTMTWQLADSFDVLPGGLCAGRGENFGTRQGARIQLLGESTGFVDETTATATFERRVDSARGALTDDGEYCVLRAVFAPSLPDPDGYSVKFPGTTVRWDHVGIGRGTRFGRLDYPPGYGTINLGSQLCPSLLDPPEKECPDWSG